ncbi:metallophosphoesterase family protein [Dermabacteraceae bacterium TAE3-ERU27]|nr:metallophosphoesterase family protein [Dermabacteraceae bacterium TAE3-ERU27]
MPSLRTWAAGGAFAAAAAGHVWARHVEIDLFTLRTLRLPLLPSGSEELRVLHLSDIHLLPKQTEKIAWLRSLAAIEPDLVINTGDNISSPQSVRPLLAALRPLLERPGVFVLGSNDMYAPHRRSPLRYFLRDPRPEGYADERPFTLPTRELTAGLSEHGWLDLDNARGALTLKGTEVEFVGVDDPHLDRDVFPSPEPRRAALRLGVAHAPYLRVLDAFAADGADAIFAGHTHGGQLRLPGVGALVTNCDLPRNRARGLSEWRGVPLNVSAGMGANPFTNMRFACRPEATLAVLTARD